MLTLADLRGVSLGTPVDVFGRVRSIRKGTAKNGQEFYTIDLADRWGSCVASR